MWQRKEEKGLASLPSSAGSTEGRGETGRNVLPAGGMANIGKSVVFKGDLSGSEDLFLDGTIEGTVELRSNSLIVGPNGRVRAGIHARAVVIEGKVDGDIQAGDRVELRKSAILVGNVVAQRIAIEDGAFFKGKVEINRQQRETAQPRTDVRGEAASAAASAGSSAGDGSRSPQRPQGVPVEQKKS
jgi:cytoskeletal protein CcmA (bactofilin family)